MKTKVLLMSMIILVNVLCFAKGENKNFLTSGEINDGDVWDDVGVWNDTTIVDMWGGTVANLCSFDSSTVNVYDGEIVGSAGPFYERGVDTLGGSIINIFGGDIFGAGSWDSATLNVRGGTIGFLTASTGLINVYGVNLAISDSGGQYGDGEVSGNWWSDGSSFAISLYGNAYDQTVLHEIPEPFSLLLFSFGGIILARRKG